MTTPNRRLAAYVRRHQDAIADLVREPLPADFQFIAFFRDPRYSHDQEMHMPDQQPDHDPIRDNARHVSAFADQHRPADVLGPDRPQDAVVELPNPVLRHERDLTGRTTFLKLGR